MSELDAYIDPDTTIDVDDVGAFDAINDPLRWRIWSQLQLPMAVRELSLSIGVAPGRLYYHLDRLAQHGWLEVVEERSAKTRPERVWRSRHRGYRLVGAAREAAASAGSGADLGMVEDIAFEMSGGTPTHDDVAHSLQLVVRGGGLLDETTARQMRQDLIELARRYLPDNDPTPPRRDPDGARRFYRLAVGVSSWD